MITLTPIEMQQIVFVTDTDLYWQGFYAYCDGKDEDEMFTEAERRGWLFANKCEGEAEDYEGDILDREWHAKGGW